jgi:uncharacterized Zn finger protein (UPF0148 family)
MKSRRDEVVAPMHAATVSAPVAVGTENKEHKRCPWCNTLVTRFAQMCKGCGFRFTLPERLRTCPKCSSMLFAFSVLCPMCRYDIEAHFHSLRTKGHHLEEEAKEFIEEKVIPRVERYEHEIADIAHHRRRRIREASVKGSDGSKREREKMAMALFARTAAPGGTACFRCGSSIPTGVHRCPKCKTKVLLT